MERVLGRASERRSGQQRVVATASMLVLGWASRIGLGALLVDRRVPLATLAEAATDPSAEDIDGSVVLPHARASRHHARISEEW